MPWLERYPGEDDVRYIRLLEDAEWARSEFPDPLITLDFTQDGRLIGIVIVGKLKEGDA